jgi:hypothetical protein
MGRKRGRLWRSELESFSVMRVSRAPDVESQKRRVSCIVTPKEMSCEPVMKQDSG